MRLTHMTLGPGFPQREELLESYAAVSGRELDAARYWQALASWKVAIIAEGVRRRRLDQPQTGATISSAAIDALLECTREIADAARI